MRRPCATLAPCTETRRPTRRWRRSTASVRRGCSSPMPTTPMRTAKRCVICGSSCEPMAWMRGSINWRRGGARTRRCGWRPEVAAADYILVVASPAYKLRAGAAADPAEGWGVQYEARLIRDMFYRDQSRLQRFLPVVLPGDTTGTCRRSSPLPSPPCTRFRSSPSRAHRRCCGSCTTARPRCSPNSARRPPCHIVTMPSAACILIPTVPARGSPSRRNHVLRRPNGRRTRDSCWRSSPRPTARSRQSACSCSGHRYVRRTSASTNPCPRCGVPSWRWRPAGAPCGSWSTLPSPTRASPAITLLFVSCCPTGSRRPRPIAHSWTAPTRSCGSSNGRDHPSSSRSRSTTICWTSPSWSGPHAT